MLRRRVMSAFVGHGSWLGLPYQRYTVSQKLLHPWFIRWQVDKRQHDKILSYIELGKREGATSLTGGKPLYEKRYYIEPPVFTDFFLVIKTCNHRLTEAWRRQLRGLTIQHMALLQALWPRIWTRLIQPRDPFVQGSFGSIVIWHLMRTVQLY